MKQKHFKKSKILIFCQHFVPISRRNIWIINKTLYIIILKVMLKHIFRPTLLLTLYLYNTFALKAQDQETSSCLLSATHHKPYLHFKDIITARNGGIIQNFSHIMFKVDTFLFIACKMRIKANFYFVSFKKNY